MFVVSSLAPIITPTQQNCDQHRVGLYIALRFPLARVLWRPPGLPQLVRLVCPPTSQSWPPTLSALSCSSLFRSSLPSSLSSPPFPSSLAQLFLLPTPSAAGACMVCSGSSPGSPAEWTPSPVPAQVAPPLLHLRQRWSPRQPPPPRQRRQATQQQQQRLHPQRRRRHLTGPAPCPSKLRLSNTHPRSTGARCCFRATRA